MQKQYFDLNIENVLDDWEIYHALREIIANALDETTLTHCRPIAMGKDKSGFWHIRDFGRGLNYTHFTQNENEEKLNAENIIGKFGVGLKDALAVLYRAGRSVRIVSKYGLISLAMHQKESFESTLTLHAVFAPTPRPEFQGTEFILDVDDDEIASAKDLFLYFQDQKPFETVSQGEIYPKKGEMTSIYVDGVKVSEEEDYSFDYNITKKSAQLKKSLNRERSAVGRSAYSGIIKSMLLESSSFAVVNEMTKQLGELTKGGGNAEIKYADVQAHFAKNLNAQDKVVFIPASKATDLTETHREIIQASGRRIQVVPDNVYKKIEKSTDYTGHEMATMDLVVDEFNADFDYDFVLDRDLTAKERVIFDRGVAIAAEIGFQYPTQKIKISESLNPNFTDTLGCYDSTQNIVVIKRDQLEDLGKFTSVLIHELIHALMGFDDNTRAFEGAQGFVIEVLIAGANPALK